MKHSQHGVAIRFSLQRYGFDVMRYNGRSLNKYESAAWAYPAMHMVMYQLLPLHGLKAFHFSNYHGSCLQGMST